MAAEAKRDVDDVRMIVFESLLEAEKNQMLLSKIGSSMLSKYAYLDKQQRKFMHCLYEGVIDKKITLDYVIDLFSKVCSGKMKKPVKTIIRMGVYQILYMDNVPDSAAINEAVKISKKKHLNNLSGFINGVLRNVARQKDSIDFPKKEDDIAKYLSVKYSMPNVVVESFIADYGVEKCEEILNNSQLNRPIIARVNRQRTNKDELIDKLNELDNVSVVGVDGFDAFYFTSLDSLYDINEFNEGDFTVQDLSSQIVGMISGIKKGDVVIDVCAAPGGKSLHAADILAGFGESEGKVIACDLTEKKLERITENINRLKVSNLTVMQRDASINEPPIEEKTDVVLCDVPCSGLGVMARKRDIKYGITREGLDSLSKLQKDIIKESVKLVKDKGTLIYSTCTIRKAENDDQLEYIKSLGFKSESFYDYLPASFKEESAKSGYLQLFTNEKNTDGFFIAKFRRI